MPTSRLEAGQESMRLLKLCFQLQLGHCDCRCIGEQFAMQEAVIALVTLYRKVRQNSARKALGDQGVC